MTPHFEDVAALAVNVAGAEAAHTKATAALAAALEARSAISARLADMTGRRREIVERRAGGDLRDDDAPMLALLDADVDGLRSILGRHDGLVAEAEAPVQQAASAVATARLLLQRAEAAATEDALTARAEQAAQVLLEALTQMRQVRDGLGGGLLRWRPTQPLLDALQRAHFGRPF